MIQNDYTTEDELKFVKGLGVKKGRFLPFSSTTTSREELLQKYLTANKNRRVDTNHKGHPAINFNVVFDYIKNVLINE